MKFEFQKSGYTALFTDDQYPSDLATNRCMALKVKLNNNPMLFKTKMSIDFYDCNNRIVYSTKEVSSKEKVYKKAYYEAVRKIFVELKQLNYSYDASLNSNENKIEAEEEIIVPKQIKVTKTENSLKTNTEPIVKEITPPIKPKVILESVTNNVKTVPLKVVDKPVIKAIEGNYNFDNWGVSTISKKGNNYVVIGGDEGFEFAIIYKTSKASIFIIKWAAYKQPQLLEVDNEGNLLIDTKKGLKVYKRVH